MKHTKREQELDGEIQSLDLDIENHRQKGDYERQTKIEEEIK